MQDQTETKDWELKVTPEFRKHAFSKLNKYLES